VRKFSAGSAKNARYASECPSSSRSRRPVDGGAAGFWAAGFWAAGFWGVRVAGLIDRESRTVPRQFRAPAAPDRVSTGTADHRLPLPWWDLFSPSGISR
jgi:hypothetical protein